jgi:hypothetical protein
MVQFYIFIYGWYAILFFITTDYCSTAIQVDLNSLVMGAVSLVLLQ